MSGMVAQPPKRGFAQSIASESVYIPPSKRRQLKIMEKEQGGESTMDAVQHQRQAWDDQKRVIHGTINRLNSETIKDLIHELLLRVNLIRLRGVLAKSLLDASFSSATFCPVFAALVAVLNSKLPQIGELIVGRTILAFRRSFSRREKATSLASALLLAHLFRQNVVHEMLILQILTLLLDGIPTDDSVEVAVTLLHVCGKKMIDVTPAGVRAVMERLRSILHEGLLSKRVEVKMEGLLNARKRNFEDEPDVPEELDLVEEDDQITFEIDLDDQHISKEEELNVFRFDNKFEYHENEWKDIKAEILGEGDESESESEGESDEEEDDDKEGEVPEVGAQSRSNTAVVQVKDLTESDLVHLRRTIYLTIMSSATFEECAHKLAKVNIPEGREQELANMLIECCSQEKTFLKYYGLVAARFCLLDDRWRNAFLESFVQQYQTIHRLETNKLRNVAKLFAHLLHSDSLPWSCFSVVHLNEDETTSSSRIFVKILFQEITEAIGIGKLKRRLDSDMQGEIIADFRGLFPRDHARNTRYAINFFTSIGLGPLTDGLRDHLKHASKQLLAQAQSTKPSRLSVGSAEKDDDSSSSDSNSSTSGSSSPSESTSSDSASYERSRRKPGRRNEDRQKKSRSHQGSSRS